ncbi:MAG TPA: hypothetical protein EYO94_09395, partial [Acidobacteria bacterium]|nr:hypothetical protein [Acidobacteriota bacterium]
MRGKLFLGSAVVVLLTSACSSTPASTSETMEMAPDVEVLQPSPGVDIDRSTAMGQVIDQQGMAGWYPHEGGLMEYRVAIRFGQEPPTMPEGWSFGRVSAVATDSNGQVFVFHRGDMA